MEYLGVSVPDGIVAEVEHDGDEMRWSIANDTRSNVSVDRARLRLRRVARGPERAFLNGWQSWSPSGSVVLGAAVDQASHAGVPGLVRAMFHADDRVTNPGECRSELVTVVADDDGAVCAGFDGGDRHDGTFWFDDDTMTAEAFLGGARMAPGERRDLHTLRIEAGGAGELLDSWATWAGTHSGARVSAPYVAGWCSWYHYFHDVTEPALRGNLGPAGDLPITLFQLDDGYQAEIGDWLSMAPTFPSPLSTIAADIGAAGFEPGLWLAPFLVSPSSSVAAEHPEWIVQRPSGRPMIGAVTAEWGGQQHVLDTTRPDVLDHLERLARDLVGMGWRYLKLDFTYAPSFTGTWHDPARTPAERVRAGFDAVRRGAGEDAFLLGCGAPLGASIAVVDGMRIGPDVAPHWAPNTPQAPYADSTAATRNAWRNTLARSFMHRRLWLNDPDCVMLRPTQTDLTAEQARTWAMAVATSGGMALLSDDLALLDGPARDAFAKVVRVGRAVDAASRAGAAPRCDDLLDGWTPGRLSSPVADVVGDPATGRLVTSRVRLPR